MTNNFWRVEYCISPFVEGEIPFDENTWNELKPIRDAFDTMMQDAGFPEKRPTCTTQYGFCYVIEYIFDLYRDDCIGMEDDHRTIKYLSPGGEGYEKLKDKCKERNFRLNTRSSSYLP